MERGGFRPVSTQIPLDPSSIVLYLTIMKTDSSNQKTKKVYRAPKLIKYGKLEDLTQGAKGAGVDNGTAGSN